MNLVQDLVILGQDLVEIYKILVKNDKILTKNDKILTKIPKIFFMCLWDPIGTSALREGSYRNGKSEVTSCTHINRIAGPWSRR